MISMNENTSALIDRLVELRKSKGLSQRQLATITGISYVVIARIETRKNSPNIETLNKLLNAMDARLTIEEIPKGQE